MERGGLGRAPLVVPKFATGLCQHDVSGRSRAAEVCIDMASIRPARELCAGAGFWPGQL